MSYQIFLVNAVRTSNKNSSLTISDKIQITIAIITLLAVLVALFQEKLREWFRKAHLKVEINTYPPDSHKIRDTNDNELIYVRIKVEHLKGNSAENVEVMLVRYWEYEGKTKKLKENFIPLNLTWANRQQRESNIKIPAGLFRYCDLGCLSRYGHNTRFRFDTIVQPNGVGDFGDLPNELGKGKYEFEVWVSGDNAKTIKKSWTMNIDGVWDDSESAMLNKHLIIKEIRK